MNYNYLKVKDYESRVEDQNHFVLSFNERQHLKVSKKTKIIIDSFNENKTLEDIRKDINNQGILFEIEDIKLFVDEVLVKNSLLFNMSYDKKNKGKSFMWFHLPIVESKKLSIIFNVLKIFYNKYIATITISLIIATGIFSFYKVILGDFSENINSISLILLMYISLVLHEFGHVSAAYSYNIKVGYMGVGMYLFSPVLYVDMTNAWRLSKRKRIIVNLGGIYFQLLLIIPLTILALSYNNQFLYAINIGIIGISLVNLIPFIKLDGYWIITDYIGANNMASNAFGVVYNRIKKIFMKKNTKQFRYSNNKPYIIFAFVYTFSTLLVLGIGIVFSINVIRNLDTIKVGFQDGYNLVKMGEIGMGLTVLNEILIFILPLIFISIAIIKISTKILKKMFNSLLDKEVNI